MISEYLKKFQSELITNKEEIHKSIQTLELQIKENKAFIKLLKEENDSNYESFSPRDINPKGREQIQHLEEQQEFLQEQSAKTRLPELRQACFISHFQGSWSRRR